MFLKSACLIIIAAIVLCLFLPTAVAQQDKSELSAKLKQKTDRLLTELADEEYCTRELAEGELRKLLQEAKNLDSLMLYLRTKLSSVKDIEVEVRLKRIVKPYVDFGITSPLVEKFPDIAERLGSPRKDIRKKAIEDLGEFKHPAAVKALIKAIKDKGELMDEIWESLFKIGAEGMEALVEALGEEEKQRRVYAAQALKRIGFKAVDPLVNALKTGEVTQRRFAAAVLGGIHSYRVVEPLMNTLKDKDQTVRQEAAYALCRLVSISPRVFPHSASIEPLIEALRSDDPLLRRYSAEIVGSTRDHRAVASLLEAIDDEDSVVRRCVIMALGRIGDSQALAPIIKALDDSDWEIRNCATKALGEIGDVTAIEHLIKRFSDANSNVPFNAQDALIKFGTKAIEPLSNALKEKDAKLRYWVVRTLGKISDTKVVEYIVKALDDKDSGVRKIAAKSLGEIGGSTASQALLKTLTDKDDKVRQEAALALAKMKSVETQTLVELLVHEERRIRFWAAWLLDHFPDQMAALPLIKTLDDEYERVRRLAARILGKLRYAAAVEPLIKLLNDEDVSVCRTAAFALGNIGNPALQALQTALEKEKDEEKKEKLREIIEKITK